MIRTLVFLISLGFSLALAEDSDLSAGDKLFASGKYEEAEQNFQQIIAHHGYSATACFDLANAQLKAGHLGHAILNYERARYYAPADLDIDHNLQLARQQAALPTDTYPWWEALMRRIPLSLWFFGVDFCVVVLALAFLAKAGRNLLINQLKFSAQILSLSIRSIFFFVTPALIFLLFFSLGSFALEQRQRAEGIVMVKDAILLVSPLAGSEKEATLPEGQLITVDRVYHDFLFIRARDKVAGWIKQTDVEPIVPGAF